MGETIGLDVVARLDKFREEMAKIPGITGVEAKAMAGQLSREIKAAERAAKGAAAGSAASWKAGLGDIRTGAEKVFGGIVGDVADVGKGIAALGPVAGAAAASMLLIGGAAAGASAAIGAAVSSIRDFAATEAALAELGATSAVTATQLASISEAQTSIDSLTAAALQAKQAFAAASADGVGDLLGTLNTFVPQVVAAGETVGRLTGSLSRGVSVAIAFAEVMIEAGNQSNMFHDAVSFGIVPLLNMADALDEVLPRAVANTKAGRDLAAANTDLAKSAEDVEAALEQERQQLIALGLLVDVDAENDERARAAKEAKAEAARRAADAAREEAAQLAALDRIQAMATASTIAAADPMHRITLQLVEQIAQIDALTATAGGGAEAVEQAELAKAAAVDASTSAMADALATQAEASNRALEASQRAGEQMTAQAQRDAATLRAAWQDTGATVAGSFGALVSLAGQSSADAAASALAALEATGTATEAELQAARDAAMSRAKMAKAAGILEITVNTAAAVTKAAASAPPPLNIPGIVAMSALGAVQLATAAAAPLPTFHTGGMIGASGSSAPDEVAIRARRNEAVLTAAGVRAVGGEAGVNAANRGESSGGSGGAVSLMLRHRVMDQVAAEAYTRRGALHRAIAGGDRVGRSTRRR